MTTSAPLSSTVSTQQPYPLAAVQRAMLHASLLHPETGPNIEQLCFHFSRPMQLTALQETWKLLIQHHDVLRTSFITSEPPMQQVQPSAHASWSILDWQTLSRQKIEQEWDIFLAEDRKRGFDMKQAPLMRFAFIELPENRSRLLWTFHHILLDGRSIEILLRQSLETYEKLLAAPSAQLPPLPPSPPYCEYVDYLNRQSWQKEKEYWSSSFKGYVVPESLAIGSRPIKEEKSEGNVRAKFDIPTTAQLHAFAQKHELTMNTLICAAWALALSQYTHSNDIVFGTVRACRHWAEADQSHRVGFFFNNIPFRVRVDPKARVLDFLQGIRSLQVELRSYELAPLDQVQAWLKFDRSSPLFESTIMFEYDTLNNRLHAALPEWSDTEITLNEMTGLPVILGCYGRNEFRMDIEYDPSRFERWVMQQALEHLQNLLLEFLHKPESPIGDLDMLSSGEREKILRVSIGKQIRLEKCVHQLFEERAQLQPQQIAVSEQGEPLTYEALNRRANQIARILRKKGIQNQTRVGLCMKRAPLMIAGVFGILKAGGVLVPIDHLYPATRKEHIIHDAALQLILTDSSSIKLLPQKGIDFILLDDPKEPVWQEDSTNLDLPIALDSASYLLYTSGSTGTPKGVVNTHQGLVNEALWAIDAFPITPEDRVLQISSIGFDTAMEEIFGCLLGGATLLLRSEKTLASREELNQTLEQLRITILDLTTTLWANWAHYLHEEQIGPCSSLKTIIVGGEKTAAGAYAIWQQVNQGRVRWINSYGPTEAAIAAANFISPDKPGSIVLLDEVPIGAPMPNTKVYILDNQQRLAPFGIVGEIYIGGVGIAQGYLNLPEKTEKAFVKIADPFTKKDECFYRTGDLALRNQDGLIEYVGRKDRQIKLRGFRIELPEIEQALCAHPKVATATVIVHEVKQDVRMLVAYVVPAPQEKLAEEEMLVFIRPRLPPYMVPQAIVFLTSLPMNANGKVDTAALPRPNALDAPVEEPTTGLQSALAAAFASSLKVDRVPLDKSFFQLGGDSLLAMELIEICAYYSISLAPQTLIQHPSVRELANYFETYADGPQAEWSPIVTLRKHGNRPPLFLVHPTPGDVMGYGNLVHHLGKDQPCYGLTSLGLHHEKACHTTIESMASYYVDHLLKFQSSGPYFLAGWCYGGIVAYEMARQMSLRGKKVDFLALIDCWAPLPASSLKRLHMKLRRLISFLRMSPAQIADYLRFKAQHRKALEEVPDNISYRNQAQIQINRARVYQENVKAALAYRAQTYNDTIDLFLAEEMRAGVVRDLKAGWPIYSSKIHYHTIPGSHMNALKEPGVPVLARQLSESIARVCN